KDFIKERVEQAAEILGLTDYLKRKPKDLSGGQRQRVALGRAIVRDAHIFLMDEHLSNLDAKLRIQMRKEIINLHIKLYTTQIYENQGLKDYMKRKPKDLSGGQRQRVALGRAIVRDAHIFLMDEPLSNLDAKLRIQMRKEIINLHRKLGTTTIYVTHDQTEAMTMASRIVVLNDGYIEQIGTPEEVYNHPKTRFVAEFMGSPPMNF